MPEKDPFTYQLMTYVWVGFISLWGGTASYIRRVRMSQSKTYSVVEWIGEVVVSGLVGLMTFFLCEWANFDRLLSAVFIAITAHMGSRALLFGERILSQWAQRRFGINLDSQDK